MYFADAKGAQTVTSCLFTFDIGQAERPWVWQQSQVASYGCNLMGAGSGGFLLCVRKENWNREEILAISTSVASSCPDLGLTLTEVDIV